MLLIISDNPNGISLSTIALQIYMYQIIFMDNFKTKYTERSATKHIPECKEKSM